MSNNPLVSIAVCTYNGAIHLEEQLFSLVNQTYKNLEIIIVDDVSSDNTIEILEKFASEDNRIKIYQNEINLGYVKNFEKAITLCQGDFIALCDQDDIWAEDKIALQVSSIGTSALIYHDSEFISETGDSLNSKISDILNMYQGKSSLPFLFNNCISGHSLMIRSDLRDKFIPLDKKYYHDWAIAFTAGEHEGIKYINKPLVKYRQHAESNTDILRIKKEKVKESKIKFNEIKPDWLRYCSNKTILHKNYILNILSCFTEDRQIKNNARLKLFSLLLDNFHLLFYLKKKSILSKMNYIRKMCFRIN
ncbi:glycosyltransferase [Pedobacter aquatilis]|uniref:glycosyltransferase n=1 Tax=Pedobacter aquatilis TaxID=351343 RepID=UPI002930844B|nr:glycosyltransferase [Pedobacter aquatilis]